MAQRERIRISDYQSVRCGHIHSQGHGFSILIFSDREKGNRKRPNVSVAEGSTITAFEGTRGAVPDQRQATRLAKDVTCEALFGNCEEGK